MQIKTIFNYKIRTGFVLFVFLFVNQVGFSQYRYSFDLGLQKKRRVSIAYQIEQKKQNFFDNRSNWKKRKESIKTSKKVRKHAYSIQTRLVKKRMKQSRKDAEYFNTGTVPLKVKLKNIL